MKNVRNRIAWPKHFLYMESKVHEMKATQDLNKSSWAVTTHKIQYPNLQQLIFHLEPKHKKTSKGAWIEIMPIMANWRETLVRTEGGVGYGAQSTWTIEDRIGQVVGTVSQCLGKKQI
jgi:hypothetical protein